jgi:hypothetical protein
MLSLALRYPFREINRALLIHAAQKPAGRCVRIYHAIIGMMIQLK